MKSEINGANAMPKKLKKLKSTTTILWRYFVVYAVGILLVIGLTAYAVLGNVAMRRSKQYTNRTGEEFMELFAQPSVDRGTITAKINDYTLRTNIDIIVFDPQGNSLFDDLASGELLNVLYKGVNANLGEWQEGKTVEYSSRYGYEITLSFAGCVSYNGQNCKLLVHYPVSNLARMVRIMELYILLIALAALAIAFFISYTLAKKLSNPIRNLSVTAENLAKGNYDVQFNSVEYEEVAKLSSTLNYMKDEIKKTDEFQKELLANVSHDLKTPLTMIKAYASMIQEISGNDPQKREKHLQVIIDESDRLTGLVNDILIASKMRSGLEQLDIKVFNISEDLYGVVNSFGYLQESDGYKIMVDIDANQYSSGDEEKIKQVFYNLISNAVNYTGEDKTVYVSLKFIPQTSSLKFSVRDTGRGISDEELSHIWDRYYRSNQTHNRPVKGTGLGLNIVKEILQRHNFNFGVTSKEAEGSTFFVDFPCIPSEGEY